MDPITIGIIITSASSIIMFIIKLLQEEKAKNSKVDDNGLETDDAHTEDINDGIRDGDNFFAGGGEGYDDILTGESRDKRDEKSNMTGIGKFLTTIFFIK